MNVPSMPSFFPTLTALLLSEPSSSVCRPVQLDGLRRRVGGVPSRSQSCLASALKGTWEEAWVSGTASNVEYTFVQHLQKKELIIWNVRLLVNAFSHLAESISIFISSTRCRRTMCLLLGIPSAAAIASVLKVGSSTMTAPWTPLFRRFSANSWIGGWREKESPNDLPKMNFLSWQRTRWFIIN